MEWVVEETCRVRADDNRTENFVSANERNVEMSEAARFYFTSANADWDKFTLLARKFGEIADLLDTLAAVIRDARRRMLDGTRDLAAHFTVFANTILSETG